MNHGLYHYHNKSLLLASGTYRCHLRHGVTKPSGKLSGGRIINLLPRNYETILGGIKSGAGMILIPHLQCLGIIRTAIDLLADGIIGVPRGSDISLLGPGFHTRGCQ